MYYSGGWHNKGVIDVDIYFEDKLSEAGVVFLYAND